MSIRRTLQGLKADAEAADEAIGAVTDRLIGFGVAGVSAVRDIDDAVGSLPPAPIGGLVDVSGRPISTMSGGSGGGGGESNRGGFATAGGAPAAGQLSGGSGGGQGGGGSFIRLDDAARDTARAVRTLDSRSSQVQGAMLTELMAIRERLDRAVDMGMVSRAD